MTKLNIEKVSYDVTVITSPKTSPN